MVRVDAHRNLSHWTALDTSMSRSVSYMRVHSIFVILPTYLNFIGVNIQTRAFSSLIKTSVERLAPARKFSHPFREFRSKFSD